MRLDDYRKVNASTRRLAWNKLQLSRGWKFAKHPTLHEIAVNAVVADPVIENLFVRDLHVPTVYVAPIVPVSKLSAHVLVKPAGIPRRVSEVKSHRLTVSQPTFANLEDLVWHRRRLVKDIKWRRGSGVQPCKTLRVFFAASLGINPPRLPVVVVIHIHGPSAASIESPPVFGNTHSVPLGQL